MSYQLAQNTNSFKRNEGLTMASQWYCKLSAGEIGPMSAGELRKLVIAGAVVESTFIRKGDSKWIQASQVRGLFSEKRSTNVEHAQLIPLQKTYRSPQSAIERALNPKPHMDGLSVYMIVLTFVAITLILSRFAPWLTVGIGILVCLVVASPLRISKILRTSNRRIGISVFAYGIILLGIAFLKLGHNSKIRSERQEAFKSVRGAELSLQLGKLEEAQNIVAILERNQDVRNLPAVRNLKTKVEEATKLHERNQANGRVELLVRQGRQWLSLQQLPMAENLLRQAFNEPGATDFGPARKLAEEILKAMIGSADKLLESGDHKGAAKISKDAAKLPGIDGKLLATLNTRIANSSVAAAVETARGIISENRLTEAESLLKEAVSTKFATEVQDAEKLLNETTHKLRNDRDDMANEQSFGRRKGKVRIGQIDSTNVSFNFNEYPKSCLSTVDKIINDRDQTIEVPRNQGVEVEVRFENIKLNSTEIGKKVSRFEIASDTTKVSGTIESKIRWKITSNRAIAYLVPSEHAPSKSSPVKLVLVLETSTGKSFSKMWTFVTKME